MKEYHTSAEKKGKTQLQADEGVNSGAWIARNEHFITVLRPLQNVSDLGRAVESIDRMAPDREFGQHRKSNPPLRDIGQNAVWECHSTREVEVDT
jgi:hypothetical protein